MTIDGLLEFSCAAAGLNCEGHGARSRMALLIKINGCTVTLNALDRAYSQEGLVEAAERWGIRLVSKRKFDSAKFHDGAPLGARSSRILLILVNVLVFCCRMSLSSAADDGLIRTFGLVPLKIKSTLAAITTRCWEHSCRSSPACFSTVGFPAHSRQYVVPCRFSAAPSKSTRSPSIPSLLLHLRDRLRAPPKPSFVETRASRPSARAAQIFSVLGAYGVSLPLFMGSDSRAALRILLYGADPLPWFSSNYRSSSDFLSE